tara:strand:+ start:554 stop:1279 length:726 start_codon:yes stop_codon:yes gene_type:complete
LKKKFGQNFLIDKNITNKIVSLINNFSLKILEIGPGDGKLTAHIIKKKPKILDIVEIDKDLIEILNFNFQKYQFVNIFNEDVLKFKIETDYDLIISNLPYNLSSKILEKMIFLEKKPKTMILMFQKEFADRLLSKDLNSINSLINCFFKINFKFNVSKNCFRPVPKVESAVLKFEKLKNNLIKKDEIKNFITFKRYIFSYKRKSLRKILKKYDIKDSIKLNLRAEKLGLNDLIEIFRQLKF